MTITFHDENCAVPVTDPTASILDVSVAARLPHFRECGGQGRCTTCRIRVLDGIDNVSERKPREAQIARERGWDDYTRLACQTHATGDVRVQRLIRSPVDVSLLQVEALRSGPGREVSAAILVCDIRQFTPFVEGNLPYDVFHILNRFFAELGEPILLNGGFIYQYVGDQIIGLFGLTGASAEKSCLGAVRAGLGMMHALQALNGQIREEFGIELGIRIGAHFGPLIVGALGHPARREFSVIGDAINMASRIERANEALGTTFLASEELFARLPDTVRAGRRAHVALKGKQGLHPLVEIAGFHVPDAELLVQQTARRLLSEGERFARTFYERLFERAPAVRNLFSGDMAAQGRMIVQMLQMAVYGFSRFTELIPGLVALGRNHVRYGVHASHFEAFRDAFRDTVRIVLGEACTPASEAAWGIAIDRILQAMRRGAWERSAHPPSTGAPHAPWSGDGAAYPVRNVVPMPALHCVGD